MKAFVDQKKNLKYNSTCITDSGKPIKLKLIKIGVTVPCFTEN